MQRTIGVVMDPIETIKPYKDSTFAMMIELQRRRHTIAYILPDDVYVLDGIPRTRFRELTVVDRNEDWYELGAEHEVELDQLDALLMRKDPPFDMEYIYATYALELAEARGLPVLNKPQALRDYNEKMAAMWFPQCVPATLVSRSDARIRDFVAQHQTAVLKPLDGMGGASIFKVTAGDPNLSALVEVMTELGQRTIMVQKFIPEISSGDKRILLVDGEPIPYALARIPAEGEFRGNLAAGATGHGQELSERDRWICQQVGPTLRDKGMVFVGLDVIGDYLTEINVTSPTGIRELDKRFSLNIAGTLIDALERRLDTQN